jgi:hypothetical protein
MQLKSDTQRKGSNMAKRLILRRKTAVRILKGLGIKSAKEMSDKKLEKKLQSMPGWLDKEIGTGDEKLDEYVDKIFTYRGNVRLKESLLKENQRRQEDEAEEKEKEKQRRKDKTTMAKKKGDKKKGDKKKGDKKSKDKKQTTAPAKSAAPRDGLGEKLSTNYHKINVALSKAKKPLPYGVLMKKIELDPKKAYHPYLNKQIAAGFIVKDAHARFALTKSGSKAMAK